MLHFCVFKKIQLSHAFVFCIFEFSKKYKFHTLHFFVFLYFPKNANSKKYKNNTKIIQKNTNKIQKNAKCRICIFWKIQK